MIQPSPIVSLPASALPLDLAAAGITEAGESADFGAFLSAQASLLDGAPASIMPDQATSTALPTVPADPAGLPANGKVLPDALPPVAPVFVQQPALATTPPAGQPATPSAEVQHPEPATPTHPIARTHPRRPANAPAVERPTPTIALPDNEPNISLPEGSERAFLAAPVEQLAQPVPLPLLAAPTTHGGEPAPLPTPAPAPVALPPALPIARPIRMPLAREIEAEIKTNEAPVALQPEPASAERPVALSIALPASSQGLPRPASGPARSAAATAAPNQPLPIAITVEPAPAAAPVTTEQPPLRPALAPTARAVPAEPATGEAKLARFEITPIEPQPLRIEPLAAQAPLPVAAPTERPGPSPAPALPAIENLSPRHDFAALVDRLVAAREAVQPLAVGMSLAHAEFGQVRIRFQHERDGLAVTLTSADPGFARAASAAPLPVLPVIATEPAQPAAGTTSQRAEPQAGGSGAQPQSRGGSPDQRDPRGHHHEPPAQARFEAQQQRRRNGIFA